MNYVLFLNNFYYICRMLNVNSDITIETFHTTDSIRVGLYIQSMKNMTQIYIVTKIISDVEIECETCLLISEERRSLRYSDRSDPGDLKIFNDKYVGKRCSNIRNFVRTKYTKKLDRINRLKSIKNEL
jgi:hypothetical protein